MNDYIQKYGEKALQVYQKSLRNSQTLKNPSPMKQNHHILRKKSSSRKLLKSNSCIKNSSQSKLNHSKSTKNTKFIQTIDSNENQKIKVSPFAQNKKINYSGTPSNGFYHTFNKINNPNKKKLTISQVTTPKCSTPLRLKQSQKIDKQRQYQRPTERNSKSNHKSAKKRKQIQQRLQETLSDKKTIKSLVKGVTQCLQIIFSQDQKMRKMFYLLKETIQKISNLAQKYKNRLKRAHQKIQELQQIQQIYMGKERVKTKSKYGTSKRSDLQDQKYKKNGIQVIILNQNYDLRKKISKLQKQIDYYTNKEASLMNVFGKYKNSDSQSKIYKIGQQSDGKTSFNYQLKKKTSIGFNSLDPNRRSSQNLNTKINAYSSEKAQQKRLSFDGYEGNIKSQRENVRVGLNENVEQLSEQESSENQ